VPTGAHLAWLAFVEYTTLHKRIKHAAEEKTDREKWLAVSQKYSKTPINPLGFVGHDRFKLDGMALLLVVVGWHS